jgi:hypothetical protein
MAGKNQHNRLSDTRVTLGTETPMRIDMIDALPA